MFKKATYLVFSMSFLLMISCGQKENVLPISQEKLLTADASKSWRLTASTRDTIKSINPSCKTNSIQNLDNKLIFSNGGAFEYSNGTITEDESCQVNGCCTDLANLKGTWLIRNDSLQIKVNARIDNGKITPVKEVELVKGKIKGLAENELILSNVDVATFIKVQ